MKRVAQLAICLSSLIAVPTSILAQSGESAPAMPIEEIKKALRSRAGEIFKPGAHDPHWNKMGVDLEKLVTARPNQVLLEVEDNGDRSITFYSNRPIADFIPADWELVAEFGSDELHPEVSSPVDVSELSDGYYVASRAPNERVGDATCSPIPTAARLYKKKGVESGIPSDIATLIFRETLDLGKPYTVCVRHDVAGDGYRSRYFFKDGRSLPTLEESAGTMKIVPMRPTAELLQRD